MEAVDPSAFYRGDPGRRYHLGKRELASTALPWIVELRGQKLGAFVRPQDVVVEFGVGAGWNLRGLRCARRIGIDVADFLKDDLGRSGIEFLMDASQLHDGIADVVICHHMLEHVLSPAETLREIRRVLRPGGTLVLNTPYEVERRWRRFRRDDANHHLFAWNPQTLGALVEVVGLSVSECGLGQYGYDRVAAQVASRVGGGARLFRLVRSILHLVKRSREVRVVAHNTTPRATAARG